MTFNIDLYDLRRREVQALGAALSCRDWYMTEKAYNSLRDKLDNAGFTVSGPPTTPKPPAGGDAGAVERAYRQGQIDMRDRAAAVCDKRGAEEQESYGLNRAAQNYFRARNAVRDLEPAALALPAPVVEGDRSLEATHKCSRRQHEDVAPAIPWTPEDGVPGAYRVGHSTPPHLADGMTAYVCIGGGAYSTIPNPRSYSHGGIVWHLTYATDLRPYVLTAGSIITSFDYLLSGAITMTEATRRLRLMRQARAALSEGRSHV